MKKLTYCFLLFLSSLFSSSLLAHENQSEAPRASARGIFTHGKCKAFSGQLPKATGSEIGKGNFAIQKPQGVSPCNPHKNFASFTPALPGGVL